MNLSKFKNTTKRILFPKGERFYTIRRGIGKGITMKIDPYNKLQRIFGIDEYEIQPYFQRYSKLADVFLDIGASDGYYFLIFCKYNKEGHVYACEPQQSFWKDQTNNAKANGIHNTRFTQIEKFIGSQQDDKTTTIDSLLKETLSKNIFIKLDIDGGEQLALSGATETLKVRNCYLIVETHSAELERNCISYLSRLGYDVKIIPNGRLRKIIPEYRPLIHNRWFVASKSSVI